jgi:hypothetical protein
MTASQSKQNPQASNMNFDNLSPEELAVLSPVYYGHEVVLPPYKTNTAVRRATQPSQPWSAPITVTKPSKTKRVQHNGGFMSIACALLTATFVLSYMDAMERCGMSFAVGTTTAANYVEWHLLASSRLLKAGLITVLVLASRGFGARVLLACVVLRVMQPNFLFVADGLLSVVQTVFGALPTRITALLPNWGCACLTWPVQLHAFLFGF